MVRKDRLSCCTKMTASLRLLKEGATLNVSLRFSKFKLSNFSNVLILNPFWHFFSETILTCYSLTIWYRLLLVFLLCFLFLFVVWKKMYFLFIYLSFSVWLFLDLLFLLVFCNLEKNNYIWPLPLSLQHFCFSLHSPQSSQVVSFHPDNSSPVLSHRSYQMNLLLVFMLW